MLKAAKDYGWKYSKQSEICCCDSLFAIHIMTNIQMLSVCK